MGVETAYWLFSTTISRGRFHIAARFSDLSEYSVIGGSIRSKYDRYAVLITYRNAESRTGTQWNAPTYNTVGSDVSAGMVGNVHGAAKPLTIAGFFARAVRQPFVEYPHLVLYNGRGPYVCW